MILLEEYSRGHDLAGYWDYDWDTDDMAYQVSTWYSMPDLKQENKRRILNDESLHWCGAFGDERFASMLNQDYKVCWAIEEIINNRPEWVFGKGFFIKKVQRFNHKKKLISTHVLLVCKSSDHDKDEQFIEVDDILWLAVLAPETCKEVYSEGI